MNHLIPIDILKLIESINQKIRKVRITGFKEKPALCLWNASVIMVPHAIIEKEDHVRKMKLAWLAEGNVGLLNYVEPFIKGSSLEKVRKIILCIK